MMNFRSVLTVSQLVNRVRKTLESEFIDVYVEGEISGMTVPRSGHFYFTLKDAKAQISAVMFRMQSRLLRFAPENGMQVVARGRISVYAPRGSMQLIVDTMEPKGAGALAAAFEQRKRDLAAKGWFDPERKQPIPELPDWIGVVTSPTGAALYDVLRKALMRNPNLRVVISPTRVQGKGAAAEIAEAIGRLEDDGRSEVIIVARGGGSLEDLWAFNEIEVAEAIHHCPIPIVTGVGHEVDFTIADFCADMRAATPTAAAEAVVPRIVDYLAAVREQSRRLMSSFDRRVTGSEERLAYLAHRLFVRGLPTTLPSQKLDELAGRTRRAIRETVREDRETLNNLTRRLRVQAIPTELASQRLHELSGRAARALGEKTRANRTDLNHRAEALVARSPARWIREQRRQLSHQSDVLAKNVSARIARQDANLARQSDMMQALSPRRVLDRGYSITRKLDSKQIVKDAATTKTGETLEVVLAKGKIQVDVKSSE
jgi:exodeoxyribonuclease VII large subunit